MIANYHTHTLRCHHATGTDREFIEQAIASGFTHLGFSEHIPLILSDGREDYYRMSMDQTEEYLSTMRALREEYSDRIRILIGFEMEYYPKYFDGMMEYVKKTGVDYLIYGQHFLNNGDTGERACVSPTEDGQRVVSYVDSVIRGMETGVFSYLAHPDLPGYLPDDDLYLSNMRRLCRAAVRTGTPLEINFLGIRQRRIYPKPSFWEIAGEEGATVVFGCDAHDPEGLILTETLPIAEELVRTYGLKLEERPPLIHPITKQPLWLY